jgi:hypothetical protein
MPTTKFPLIFFCFSFAYWQNSGREEAEKDCEAACWV